MLESPMKDCESVLKVIGDEVAGIKKKVCDLKQRNKRLRERWDKEREENMQREMEKERIFKEEEEKLSMLKMQQGEEVNKLNTVMERIKRELEQGSTKIMHRQGIL
ncbi:hypothetical protein ACOME3_004733 [Neoechinorhynchus agilis]